MSAQVDMQAQTSGTAVLSCRNLCKTFYQGDVASAPLFKRAA